MDESQAWINGRETPFSQLALPVWDLGVVAGASVTEMARTFCHEPFQLSLHLQRLEASCVELGFEMPFRIPDLADVAERLVLKNIGLIDENDDLGIVAFVTAGANPTYLGTENLPGGTTVVHTYRLPLELWRSAAEDGVRLTIPKRKQIPEFSLPVNHKTRNRLHWWLADREADAEESGSRALLLDSDGLITETSTACFFAVIEGALVTPHSQVLDSLSRRMVRNAAAECGLKFEQRGIPAEEVPMMEEAFLSSTPSGLLRVRSIDRRVIGSVGSRTVMPELLAYWEKVTGLNPLHQILTRETPPADAG
ncbi:MAG: aminotransferase class IV [Fuerstiella sp.]|nr:aminotransferase class IV [Fuerstiella sp.]